MDAISRDSLSKVLFGNQAQASVINDAVVGIVGDSIEEYKDCILSEYTQDKMIELLKSILEDVVAGESHRLPASFIKLVAGEDSFSNSLSSNPLTVTVTKPSQESPKHCFRIKLLDSKVSPIEPPRGYTGTVSKSIYTEVETHEHFSIREEAERRKKSILAVVPQSIKKELEGDDFAQAMMIAPEFYS